MSDLPAGAVRDESFLMVCTLITCSTIVHQSSTIPMTKKPSNPSSIQILCALFLLTKRTLTCDHRRRAATVFQNHT